MKRIFERMGGVLTKLWFDNLSSAVIAVELNGKRKLTEAFERFALHYRFEAVFCYPGKGNEKGNVKNKVGYTDATGAAANWLELGGCIGQKLQQVGDVSAALHESGGPDRMVKMLRVFRFKPRSLPYVGVFKLLPASISGWLMESAGTTAPTADVHTPFVLLGKEPEMSTYDRLTQAVTRR